MTIELYFHPFSSFCMKALIAFHEKEVPFEPHVVDLGDPESRGAFLAIWPIGKFPAVRDTDQGLTLVESSIIIEHVDRIGAVGPQLIPADPDRALRIRQWERVLDDYLHLQMQAVVGDRIRPDGSHDLFSVDRARNTMETTFGLLEEALGDDGWLCGEFSLADCAAAPPLFYAAKLTDFPGRYPKLGAYLDRLMARPSFRRALDQARFFRPFFPAAPTDAGWPDE